MSRTNSKNSTQDCVPVGCGELSFSQQENGSDVHPGENLVVNTDKGGDGGNEQPSSGTDPYMDIAGSKLVWQIDPRPAYCGKVRDFSSLAVLWYFDLVALQYYGFSIFAMSLNEMDEDMKHILAPTDCRFRPDMRLLENGDLGMICFPSYVQFNSRLSVLPDV